MYAVHEQVRSLDPDWSSFSMSPELSLRAGQFEGFVKSGF